MKLVDETLRCIINNQEVRIPRYDKSLRGGKGDRGSSWTIINSKKTFIYELFAILISLYLNIIIVLEPIDIVLFEGWMMGFAADNDNNKYESDNTYLGIDYNANKMIGIDVRYNNYIINYFNHN